MAQLNELERRRKPELTMFEWDTLARDYMRRSVDEDRHDPLHGKWGRLERGIHAITARSDVASKHSVALLYSLRAFIGAKEASAPPWRRRLGEMLGRLPQIDDQEDAA